jgi:NADPH:quinone reductase-like Zn-dependent oxidoreductase
MVELLGKKHQIPVINIVRSQKHVDSLKKMGSGHVLNSSSPSFTDELGTLAKELQATVLFDSVCSRQLEKMIEVLPAGSSVIIYGNLSGEEQIMINPRSLIDNNINISGFFLGQRSKENGMLKNMMNLIEVRGLMKKNLTIKVQGRYPLKSAQEAVDIYLEKMSEGKVLLIPGF